MMINPVSFKQLKSIPASIPASTPLKPSFKGNDEGDTVEISRDAAETQETTQETAQETTEAAPEDKKKFSVEDIQRKTEEVTAGMEAFGDGVDKAANTATGTAAKISGAIGMIGATISKLIPAPVKDFFATPVVKQVKDEAGNLVDALDEAGHKIYATVKDSKGVERVVRKFNAKHTAIAVGIAAAVAFTIAVVKHIKNKEKQDQKD